MHRRTSLRIGIEFSIKAESIVVRFDGVAVGMMVGDQ